MKRVLLLGASGLIAPHIIPALEKDYDLRLADIKEHPDGRPVRNPSTSAITARCVRPWKAWTPS